MANWKHSLCIMFRRKSYNDNGFCITFMIGRKNAIENLRQSKFLYLLKVFCQDKTIICGRRLESILYNNVKHMQTQISCFNDNENLFLILQQNFISFMFLNSK